MLQEIQSNLHYHDSIGCIRTTPCWPKMLDDAVAPTANLDLEQIAAGEEITSKNDCLMQDSA